MAKKAFVGVLLGTALVFSIGVAPASALTIDEVQAQIKALLSQIADLTAALNTLRGQTNTSTSITVDPTFMPNKHRVCNVLYRNLATGTQGDDVVSLQEFLKSEGYLSANATGYFGPITAKAVANWQTSQGVLAVGSFGPMSRERIKIWCGNPTPGPKVCTKEYKPVCGSHQIYCITTPCNPIQQTYSNRCMMNADGATLLYEGQCRQSVYQNPGDDPQCRTWTDGLYCGTVCSRSEPWGVPQCVAKMCAATGPENAVPRCTAWFDDAGNKPPVISGFSGPTILSVNSTGTWTINASDPENGQLSYDIRWGDEPVPMGLNVPMSAYAREFVQTTTFTHAYATYGTYTVTIVVRDSAGQEAKTSTTVKVGNDIACTMEYNPVCGQPPEPACRHSIPACMMATPGPQTYSNRCMMNAAGASFLYEGQCASGY